MLNQVTDFLISVGIPHKFVPLAWTAGIMLALLIVSTIVNTVNILILRAMPGQMGRLVCCWLTAPGVIIHECSHAFFAMLTGAKVTKVVFFGPKGDVLGYVNYRTRGKLIAPAIQRMLASVAPVIIGPLAVWGFATILISTSLIWLKAIMVYLIFAVVMHMELSSQDVKEYLKGCAIVIVIVALVCIIAIP